MNNSQAHDLVISLCAPTPQLSCFGCCPPIRPSHYDPLAYASSLKREFRENRRGFLGEGPRFKPIVGYHCWALGFLDKEARRVGCLLHPHRNEGRDLRSLIDYGNKCERESCLPARMFSHLPPEGKRFWVPLVQGLNAFYFSSPRSNPLFHLLLWGPGVLEPLRSQAEEQGWTETEMLHHHPFLLGPAWDPRSDRYFFRLILESVSLKENMGCNLEASCRMLREAVRSLPELTPLPDAHFLPRNHTHLLPLEEDFLDFLRLGLGWQKTSMEEANPLKQKIEQLMRKIIPM